MRPSWKWSDPDPLIYVALLAVAVFVAWYSGRGCDTRPWITGGGW